MSNRKIKDPQEAENWHWDSLRYAFLSNPKQPSGTRSCVNQYGDRIVYISNPSVPSWCERYLEQLPENWRFDLGHSKDFEDASTYAVQQHKERLLYNEYAKKQDYKKYGLLAVNHEQAMVELQQREYNQKFSAAAKAMKQAIDLCLHTVNKFRKLKTHTPMQKFIVKDANAPFQLVAMDNHQPLFDVIVTDIAYNVDRPMNGRTLVLTCHQTPAGIPKVLLDDEKQSTIKHIEKQVCLYSENYADAKRNALQDPKRIEPHVLGECLRYEGIIEGLNYALKLLKQGV